MKTTVGRIAANPQSKGNLGKSLETECRIAWLDRHGIEWRGSDLDDRHATLFTRHPEQVKPYKLGNKEEAKAAFLALFRGILRDRSAVHVIDTRAQADELFASAVEELDFFALCEEQGLRMTFVLFPSDEVESMQNFAALVKFGGSEVDYVVVLNPTKSKGDLYRGSRLEKSLQSAGAKTITLPTITPVTLVAMERAESKAGRGIPFAEFAAAESDRLERIMAGELQWALARMFEQYDAVAELLLPTALAEKVKGAATGAKSNKKPSVKENEFSLNLG